MDDHAEKVASIPSDVTCSLGVVYEGLCRIMVGPIWTLLEVCRGWPGLSKHVQEQGPYMSFGARKRVGSET